MKSVFIDGEAGTTGLQIRERLAHVEGLAVESIDAALRKDPKARRDMMRGVDLVVLCLPDDAAREAVALADELGSQAPKIIDASTAHRTAADWVYGFPELMEGQSERIARAARVSNPGCYATGAIAIIRPLVFAKWVAANQPLSINAVSGYTGGGKAMIGSYDSGKGSAFELYGLGLDHKHIPEIMTHCGLTRRPIFIPSVGAFAQGMFVSLPLHLDTMAKTPMLSDLTELYRAHYPQGTGTVRLHVNSKYNADQVNRLHVEEAAGDDAMDLWVFGNDAQHQALVVARLDNLGKGAAGAAVQNIKLMLGLN